MWDKDDVNDKIEEFAEKHFGKDPLAFASFLSLTAVVLSAVALVASSIMAIVSVTTFLLSPIVRVPRWIYRKIKGV